MTFNSVFTRPLTQRLLDLYPIHDIGDSHLETFSNRPQDAQTRIRLSSLDLAHIGAVEATVVCEGFLRESALTAECSNPQPQTPTEFGATIPRLHLNNFGSILGLDLQAVGWHAIGGEPSGPSAGVTPAYFLIPASLLLRAAQLCQQLIWASLWPLPNATIVPPENTLYVADSNAVPRVRNFLSELRPPPRVGNGACVSFSVLQQFESVPAIPQVDLDALGFTPPFEGRKCLPKGKAKK